MKIKAWARSLTNKEYSATLTLEILDVDIEQEILNKLQNKAKTKAPIIGRVTAKSFPKNLPKKYSFSDIGKDNIYSKVLLSLSPAIVLTVFTKINIGTITIQISININKSLLNPLNPCILDSVIPVIKNKAIIPPKTRVYIKNHFDLKASFKSVLKTKYKFFIYFALKHPFQHMHNHNFHYLFVSLHKH